MSSPPTPFLHLKFTSLRPPPQYGHQLPFSHQLDPSIHELPDSLKTDVQREGIKRYLLQNFKDGSFVWEVVKERLESEEEKGEGKDSDGMYLVVNRSWARTVGDNKLHLSLYVYQEDKHCATWHAYTDRTISYSREGDATSADAAQEDPDAEANDQEELEEDFSPIPNEDPYSPPSALAQYVATMDSQSRPSSPFVPPERDSERPRFDRPYKEPVVDSDEEQEAEEARDKGRKKDREREEKELSEEEEVHKPVIKDRRSRSSRKPKEEVQSRSESPEEVEKPQERRSRSARREKKPVVISESEEEEVKEKSKPKKREESDSEQDDPKPRSKPDYPIVKSKPIGHQSSRNKVDEDSSVSRSRSPTPPPVVEPVKSRSSRSKRREPSPQSISRSPSPPRRDKERSPSPTPSPVVEEKPAERGRSRRSENKPAPSASPSRSRSPSPLPKTRSTPSKPPSPSPVESSRSPSPAPVVKKRSSRRGKSEFPHRSPSPPTSTQPERSRSKARGRHSQVEEIVKKEVKKVEAKVRKMSTSRSRSRSRSPSLPAARRERSRVRKAVEEEKEKVKKVVEKVREKSRSPSPKPTRSRHSRHKSPPPSPSLSSSPPPKPRHSRRKSVSRPDPDQTHPQAIHRSTATPSVEPTWRSVSRNRHRRADDSDDDTLVRGNMDDHELDIPAGGESTLLKAKPKKRSGHHATKDEAFDPDEVERSRVQREKEKVVEPQTLKSAVGGWFKSVGSLIATEAKSVVGAAEEEVLKAEVGLEEWEEKEREERRKRKAERAKRREERRRQKEAMEEGKRDKEEELENMVDRAEDAAEGMMETSEKLTAKKVREARKEKERRKESNVSDEEDEPTHHRRHRSERKPTRNEEEPVPVSSTRSHTKHRSSRPASPVSDQEERRLKSRQAPEEKDSKSTHSSRRHRSRRTEPPSDHEDEPASPPSRPALRQRAMSISASVDAGIKGLRESVNKIVSSAGQVDKEKDDSEEEREARKAEREKRKIEKERKAIEEERKNIEAEEKERKKRLEADSEDDRMKERARLPRINTVRKSDEDEPPKSSRRSRHSRPSTPPSDLEPPQTSHRLHDSPSQNPFDSEFSEASAPHSNRSSRRKPTFTSDEESEAPSRAPRSSRLDRQAPSRPPVSDPEESEASIAPIQSRQRPVPPPRARSYSVTSDTDMSDAPSRSGHSMRSMDRSESEADTPAHLEAKRNARRNSTTIPIETIRSLREQQLSSGTRSIASSPVTTKSRQDFPSRTHQLEEELHRSTLKLAETARKEKDHLVDEVHKHRKSRQHRNRADSSSDNDSRFDASRKHTSRGDTSDEDDRFDISSIRSKPTLAPPSIPAYPRRLSPVPLSATSPISPYSYSPTDPPIRPQAIKPSSYRAPPPTRNKSTRSNPPPPKSSERSYTPYSSDESSDEADPSRSTTARERRGYRSGSSIGSERSTKRTQESPSSSYRFPSSSKPYESESESDGEGIGYSRGKEEESAHRRVQSFTRTQDALPFSSDSDEEDDEAFEPVLQPLPPPITKQSRYPSSYVGDEEESERDSYPIPHSTTPVRSRTMVSAPKPSSAATIHNNFDPYPSSSSSAASSRRYGGIPPPPPQTAFDNDYGFPSSSSTSKQPIPKVDPYSSSYSSYTGTPSIHSPISSTHGFTGFDSRTSSSCHSLSKTHERRNEQEDKRERKGLGKSSIPFGKFEAPVGRRMARRLQGEM